MALVGSGAPAAETSSYLQEQEIVTSAAVFGGNTYSRLVTHCGSNPDYDAEIAVFDLSFAPEDYLGLSVDELAAVMKRRTKPIRTIRANSQPILMSRAMALEGAAGADLPPEELEHRAGLVRGNPDFRARVGEALAAQYVIAEPSPYVEGKIYDAFPPRTDEAIMERFHRSEWRERLELAQRFDDPRLRELARRLIYLERPELLSERARLELYDWRVDRLLTEDPDVPWRTIPKAQQEADDLLKNADGEERDLLVSVKAFLSDLADSMPGA